MRIFIITLITMIASIQLANSSLKITLPLEASKFEIILNRTPHFQKKEATFLVKNDYPVKCRINSNHNNIFDHLFAALVEIQLKVL